MMQLKKLIKLAVLKLWVIGWILALSIFIAWALNDEYKLSYWITAPLIFLGILFVIWNEPQSWKDKAILQYSFKNYFVSSSKRQRDNEKVSENNLFTLIVKAFFVFSHHIAVAVSFGWLGTLFGWPFWYGAAFIIASWLYIYFFDSDAPVAAPKRGATADPRRMESE